MAHAEKQADDPVLTFLRRRLNAVYGARLESVLLFGSRARGDARPDSDYDIAVFLRDLDDPRLEADRLAGIGWEALRDKGRLISPQGLSGRGSPPRNLDLEDDPQRRRSRMTPVAE